jgi:hypothetical protein
MVSQRTTGVPAQPDADSLTERLVGTWQLRSRIDLTASGERCVEPTLGDDPLALVFFDRRGNFAAQFMRRDRSTAHQVATGGSNNTRAVDGYDAYFGSYAVDEERGVVTTTLRGALAREHLASSH